LVEGQKQQCEKYCLAIQNIGRSYQAAASLSEIMNVTWY